MITLFNGKLKAYFYREGYLRTSSKEFNLGSLDNKMVHLTNDAIQKRSDDYGKFENGNKVSYDEFEKYLGASAPSFTKIMLPKMEAIVKDTIKATAPELMKTDS